MTDFSMSLKPIFPRQKTAVALRTKVVNCYVLGISIDLAREGHGIHLLFLFSRVSRCISRGCKNKMHQQQLFNKNKALYCRRNKTWK